MRFCISLLIAVYASSQAMAQPLGTTYGGLKEDQGIVVKKTSDGNLLTIGFSSSFSESSDIYLIKTNLQGKLIWEKTYGGNGDDYGWDMEELEGEKAYLITGFSDSYGSGDTDIILLKVTTDGNLVWLKNIATPAEDDRAVSMEKMNDGNFLLIGQSKNRVTRNYDGLAVKINPEGELIWKVILGGGSYDRLFYGAESSNGDLVLTGITRRDSVADNSGWLILLDNKGKQKQSQRLETIRNTTPHGLVKGKKNNFYVIGYAQTDPATNQRAIYIALLDKRSTVVWQKTLDVQSANTHGLSGFVKSSGDIMITGYTRSLDSGKWNGVLYKADKNGVLVWKKEFGGPESDMPYTVAPVSEDTSVVVGQTYSFGRGKNDVWIIFFDEMGNMISNK